jgi:hypothetical protein
VKQYAIYTFYSASSCVYRLLMCPCGVCYEYGTNSLFGWKLLTFPFLEEVLLSTPSTYSLRVAYMSNSSTVYLALHCKTYVRQGISPGPGRFALLSSLLLRLRCRY